MFLSFHFILEKTMDKKTLALYIGAGVITISSLIYGYASYQATYFKDAEINKLKTDLEEANTKLQRIDELENQVKELEASLAAKAAVKAAPKKETKPVTKKEVKKTNRFKKMLPKKRKQLLTKLKKRSQ